MWKYILTVLIAVAKIGTIWSTKRMHKKAFQSATVIIVMIIIIKIDKTRELERKKKKLLKFYDNE